MAELKKPFESRNENYGKFRSKCGGSPYAYRFAFRKQAYVDTEYLAKAALGIPKLLMPYSVLSSVATDSPGRFWSASLWACFGGFSANTLPAETEAASKAVDVLYKKLNDENSFNLGVALAEMKETVGLVASTATRIYKTIHYLRRGDIRKAFSTIGIADNYRIPNTIANYRKIRRTGLAHRRSLKKAFYKASDPFKFAAETWLEINYGWTPLLLDVYGSAEYVANLLHKTDVDLSLNAFAQSTNIDFSSTSSSIQTSGSGEVKVGYVYHLKIANKRLRNYATLGLTNPLLIAWELVPFSFVLDWFLPIGTYLNSLSATDGFTVVQGCKSVKTKYKMDGVSLISSLPCSGTIEEDRFERTLSGFPRPVFPSFNISSAINASRAASALSLLKVVFGR